MQKKLEKEIQKEIIEFLRYSGFFVYKNNNVGIYKKETGKYIPSQTRGIPDLTAIGPKGQVYQIEVKRPGGIQSKYQKTFQEQWEKHGGIYILGGLNEVIKGIEYVI